MTLLRKMRRFVDYYIPSMPWTYWIDITSVCNLRCVMCPQSKGIKKRQAKMPMETFTGIIDEICENHPLIKLYMSGEPLLHENLLDMIEYASAKGCQTMIHTNATLLTEEMSKRLLSSSLTFLSFSFDGCTPETYEKLRTPAKFEKVKSNIEQYLDLKLKNGNRGPHTSIEIIKMKDTDVLIDEFIAQWNRSGVDKVSITQCMTWLDSINDRRSESPPNYGFKPCSAPFHCACILSDGTLVPCCLDVNGEMSLGNITKSSFREIWLGDEYRRLRKQMLTARIPKGSICDGCYNTFCTSRTERVIMSVPRLLSLMRQY